MPIASDNPFASPQSDEVAPQPFVDGDGAMPRSVKLAIGCLAVFLALAGYNFVDLWIRGLSLLWAFPFAFGLYVLVGLPRRNPFARRWARLLSFVGASYVSLVLAVGVFNVWYSGTDWTGQYFSMMLMQVAIIVGMALMLWIPFFALGSRSAKSYFRPAI